MESRIHKNRSRKVRHDVWERHKDDIKQLYITEDMTLEDNGHSAGVITLMKSRHALSASKAQYESQFKKWGFRKNLKKEEWQVIASHLASYKDQPEVKFLGQIIPHEKVRKETKRYGEPPDMRENRNLPFQLPPGVTIQSSRSPKMSLTPMDTDTQVFPTDGMMDNPSAVTEPPSQYGSQIQDQELNILNDFVTGNLMDHPSAGPSMGDTVFGQDFNANTNIQASPTWQMMNECSNRNPSQEIVSFARSSPGYEILPISPYFPPIQDNTTFGAFDISTQFFNPKFPRSILSLFENWNSQSLPWLSTLKVMDLKSIREISNITIIFPAEHQMQLQSKSFDVVLFNLIMFLLLNNFADDDNPVFQNVFKQLRNFTISHVENILDNIPEPYSIGLQQSMLILAIKFDSVAVVKVVLRRNRSINFWHLRDSGKSYDPLNFSCLFLRVDIVRALLKHEGITESHPTPIECLYHHNSGRRGIPVDDNVIEDCRLQILPMLIEFGIEITAYDMQNVLQHSYDLPKVIEMLAEHSVFIFDSSINNLMFKELELRYQQDSLDNQNILRVLNMFFIKNGKLLRSRRIPTELDEIFAEAARKGDQDILNFAVWIGATPTNFWLMKAIQGNQIEIVRRFLHKDVGIDLIKPTSPGDLSFFGKFLTGDHAGHILIPYSGNSSMSCDPILLGCQIRYADATLLAESIRWKRPEIEKMLLDEGAMDAIPKKRLITTAMIAACEIGDIERVESYWHFMLESRGGLFRSYKDDDHVLRSLDIAALGGHQGVVEKLLDLGAAPTLGMLDLTILARNRELLSLCLDIGCSATSCLVLAERWGRLDVVSDLIMSGAGLHNPEPGLFYKTTAIGRMGFIETQSPVSSRLLTESIASNNVEVLNLLMENGAHPSPRHIEENSPLSEVWNLMIEKGADPSPLRVEENSPLSDAVHSGSQSMVKLLLDRGADPNDVGAFQNALSQSMEMIRILLRASSNRRLNPKIAFVAIVHAIETGNTSLVDEFKKYANFNNLYEHRGDSLLGFAVRKRNIPIIRAILHAGGDSRANSRSNAPSPHVGRWTVLMEAIATNDREIIQLILDEGGTVNEEAKLRINRTPLQLAVEIGDFEIVTLLLERGAEVNAAPCIYNGATAFQLAAKKGNTGLAELLLQRGAKIDAPGCKWEGRTAFEFATENGRLDMMLWLYHRDFNLRTNGQGQFERAIELARPTGQRAARRLAEQMQKEVSYDTAAEFLSSFAQ